MNKKQSKKLKKSPKKNFLFQSFGLGTILLTAFSMFSSGFSSWVIVREGKELINLGLEVEDTVKVNVEEFITFEKLERDYIEITPKGFVINETLIDGKYASKFDVPFKFIFSLSKLYDYLSESDPVKIKVTLKNEIEGDFGLFKQNFMGDPELSVSASAIADVDITKDGYVQDEKSFVKTLSFTKISQDVEFLLTYHFDFSSYFNDKGVALSTFVTSVYNNFPETVPETVPETENTLNFILEVEIPL